MYKVILAVLIALGLNSFALTDQDDIWVKINVIVTDFEENIQPNELVHLVAQGSKKIYKGTTNTEGKFEVKLPHNETYDIKIKSLGEATTSSSFQIPELTSSGAEYTLTVQYEDQSTYTLDITFETGKSNLTAESYKYLDEIVDWMKRKPKLKIEVAGHTDDVGDDDANLTLSQKRANAVKDYLVKKGVAANRIVAKGYGEKEPVATNETPEGRAQNRRTEVRVL
ncbi:MAG: OmpA family protein [Bacteroidetes bacterium]|nr:OmpA family protein [Bacteroidota bacterium]